MLCLVNGAWPHNFRQVHATLCLSRACSTQHWLKHVTPKIVAVNGGESFKVTYTCRFFMSLEDYKAEMSLFEDPAVRQTLPKLLHAADNASGAVRSPLDSLYAFPPFAVRERGMTLRQWRARPRSYTDILTLVDCLAQLLRTLHASGRAHRNLTPDGVILLQNSTKWRLLDLDNAANIGAARYIAHCSCVCA